MKKKTEGKVIRAAVVAGVVFLHFVAAYVVGGVIRSLYSGSHQEEYAEVTTPETANSPGASRGPASVAKPRTTHSPGSPAGPRDEGREFASEGEYTFHAGGEESGSFAENFFQYLETGNWPRNGERKQAPAELKKDEVYGIGGVRGTAANNSGGANSTGSTGTTTAGSPRINVMAPFFVSNPTGSVSDVTGAGYKVSATGGAALSSIHGVTTSGYRVWFNQGGQVSAQ